MDKCSAHDEMVRSVGAIEEATNTLKLDNSKIFDLLSIVQNDLTEALTKAQFRADAIAAIDKKIENGLKSSVNKLSEQMKALMACNDRRTREREIERLHGLGGFVRVGWTKFKDQLSFIMICTGFVIMFWSVAWILQKAAIFQEMPWGLFKLLGIG